VKHTERTLNLVEELEDHLFHVVATLSSWMGAGIKKMPESSVANMNSMCDHLFMDLVFMASDVKAQIGESNGKEDN
jgi:hypothetical protein